MLFFWCHCFRKLWSVVLTAEKSLLSRTKRTRSCRQRSLIAQPCHVLCCQVFGVALSCYNHTEMNRKIKGAAGMMAGRGAEGEQRGEVRGRWECLPRSWAIRAVGWPHRSPTQEQFSETKQIYKDYGKVYFVLPTASCYVHIYIYIYKQLWGFLKLFYKTWFSGVQKDEKQCSRSCVNREMLPEGQLSS